MENVKGLNVQRCNYLTILSTELYADDFNLYTFINRFISIISFKYFTSIKTSYPVKIQKQDKVVLF
jgi:hypothetical protein